MNSCNKNVEKAFLMIIVIVLCVMIFLFSRHFDVGTCVFIYIIIMITASHVCIQWISTMKHRPPTETAINWTHLSEIIHVKTSFSKWIVLKVFDTCIYLSWERFNTLDLFRTSYSGAVRVDTHVCHVCII